MTTKGKILVVEDEALVAQHIEEQLEDCGYKVTSQVSYGELVSDEVKYHDPDLVLMDIMLKGEINGIEAARQLKSFSDVPVIFLTAYGDRSMFEKAKQTNPYGFLTKPFRPQELYAAIELAIIKNKGDIEHEIENKVSTENMGKRQERSEKALSRKKSTLARMNHELRTPLNVIIGFGSLLQTESEHSLTEQQKHYLKSITTAGFKLTDVVTGILELAEIEGGTIPVSIENLDVVPLIENLIKEMRPLAEKAGINIFNSLALQEKVLVVADARHLNQVMMNLISNAIQYNKKDGSVLIEIGRADSNKVQIRVSDTGHGIPNEKLDTVFEPFNRLGREYSTIEGIGLGLSVARGLIKLMNGTILVESEVEKGTSFTIELPTV